MSVTSITTHSISYIYDYPDEKGIKWDVLLNLLILFHIIISSWLLHFLLFIHLYALLLFYGRLVLWETLSTPVLTCLHCFEIKKHFAVSSCKVNQEQDRLLGWCYNKWEKHMRLQLFYLQKIIFKIYFCTEKQVRA